MNGTDRHTATQHASPVPRGSEALGPMFHARHSSFIGAALPFALLSLTGCGSSTPPPAARTAVSTSSTATPSTPVTTAIDAAQVESATISGVFTAPFTLAGGNFEGAPFEPGGASRPMAVLMTPLVRLGELDAHPGADAAALIASNEGGSGEQVTLAVVGRVDGKAVSLATAPVGDRVRVRDVRISGRDIALDVVQVGPGQPACCGTELATRTFRLDGATLKETGAQVTGTLSLASTVAGHTWTMVALDNDSLPAGVTAPTLTLADGRLSGNSGCNQYNGGVSEPEPGALKVGPTAGTRRACEGEEAEVERRFLSGLAKATRYTFLAGRLVISGLDGDQMRSLTFTRQD